MEANLFYQMAELEENHWWFVGRRKIAQSLIRRIIKLEPDAAILDAGCGTGGNLKFLSQLGNVVGMELDDEAILFARMKDVAPVVRGNLPQHLPFQEESFDLVVLFDVLEHLDDDDEALKALFLLTKPGGYLLLTVPAFPFLWSGHDESHHHRRRYLLPGLSSKITSAGFRLEYISYFNSWLFPVISLIRLFKSRISTRNSSSDLCMPNRILNGLLKTLLGSESVFAGWVRLPVGVSIIACGQKR